MRSLGLLLLCLCATLFGGCYEEPVAIVTPDDEPPMTFQPSSARPSTPRPTGTATGTPRPAQTPIDLSTPTAGPDTPTPAQATATPLPLTTPTAAVVPSTPTPFTTPVAAGSPFPGCRDGWIVPSPITPEFDEALLILETFMGVEGPWAITEMRYFTGPDSPGVIEPRFDPVERWYIRASLATDTTFRGRWLLEKRTETIKGIAAVAPFESEGYESPDWTGFVGEGEPRTYLGLPGQWSGIAYDFVTGEGDSGNPGLPPEVVGCLAGT